MTKRAASLYFQSINPANLACFAQVRTGTGMTESAVRWVDLAGYIACSLVFLTFYMRGMVSLRLVALCSNVAFLIYAFNLHLAPIAILHGALIPVNVVRLVAALREDDLTLAIWIMRLGPRKRRV